MSFAFGEKGRILFGYSAHPVAVSTVTGTYGGLTWDAATQIFTVNVHPEAGKAHIRFRALGTPVRTGGCLLVGCTAGRTIPKTTQNQ